jgi:aspartate aminotransferase
MRQEFDKRRKVMVSRLREIPGVKCVEPKGAFYAFPDLSAFIGKKTPEGKKLENDVQLCEWLLEAAKVAVVMGSAFGAPGFVRLSYATSMKNIEEGVRRMAEWLPKLA